MRYLLFALLLMATSSAFGQLAVGTQRKPVYTDTNGLILNGNLTSSNSLSIIAVPTNQFNVLRLADLTNATIGYTILPISRGGTETNVTALLGNYTNTGSFVVRDSLTVTTNLNLIGAPVFSTSAPTINQWYTNGIYRRTATVAFLMTPTVTDAAQVEFLMVSSAGVTNAFGTLKAPANLPAAMIGDHTVFMNPGASYIWTNQSSGLATVTVSTYFHWQQ